MIQVLINRYPHIVTAMRYVKNFGLKNTVCSFILYVGGLRLLVSTKHINLHLFPKKFHCQSDTSTFTSAFVVICSFIHQYC
jgi:hypothetical protein